MTELNYKEYLHSKDKGVLLRSLLGFDVPASIMDEKYTSVEEIVERTGVTRKQGKKVLILQELLSRGDSVKERPTYIKSSVDLYQYAYPIFHNIDHEEFHVMFISVGGKIEKMERITTGGYDNAFVDIRMVIRQCLIYRCTAIALFHNHLGGTITPSLADIRMTNELATACRFMHIRLVDHIIMDTDETTYERYYSFSDKEMLP